MTTGRRRFSRARRTRQTWDDVEGPRRVRLPWRESRSVADAAANEEGSEWVKRHRCRQAVRPSPRR
jgi:hypothetical protein